MFIGVLALLERSLRIDARSWPNHLARLGLMLGIYVSLASAFALAGRFGAPGLRFFSASIYLNVIFLTLLGVGFFSTAITEEKEEDTLGLMLMAGISPLGILLGKLGGRLIQALLLIVVQYPFTLLAITMGGVSQSQVNAAYVGLTSYMLLLAGGGLLCSTLAPLSRTAGTWMVIALFAYGVIPYFCQLTLLFVGISAGVPTPWWATLLTTVSSTCLFLRIGDIITTGFGESPWSWQAVSNLALGLVCFALSWGCFGYVTREPATEAITRGALARSKWGLASSFSPGRAWNNPFVWKDFHFVAGGLSLRLLRIGFYAGLYIVSCWLSALWRTGGRFGLYGKEILGVYQFLLLFALSWEAALLMARSIHDEVSGKTLASLVMLPRSTVHVVYSKLFGSLVGAYPSLLCFLVANVLGIAKVTEFFRDGPAVFILAHFVLVPHLAAIYALWLRWGAVPLAIGTMIGSIFGWISYFQANRIQERSAFVTFVGLLILGVCAGCHWVLLNRIRHIAARG